MGIMDAKFADWRRFPSWTEQKSIAWKFREDVRLREAQRGVSSGTQSTWDGFLSRFKSWVHEKDISEAEKKRILDVGFHGFIASTVGTYSLGSFVQRVRGVDVQELFYTGFKKIHGWKLLTYISHFQKRILHIQVCPASVGDPTAHVASGIAQLLAPGCYVAGDHAFHNSFGVIPGYLQSTVCTRVLPPILYFLASQVGIQRASLPVCFFGCRSTSRLDKIRKLERK